MKFLPIVERELRVAARRRRTYWTRLLTAAAAITVGGWIMRIPDLRTPGALGLSLFISLSVFTLIYCSLAGLRATSDCLSEEKREGTLGLLFLTDLKGYDVVLGKLAARSLHVVYGILAIFPVLAISLLVGSVSGAEFGRVVLVALNNLFFSLAVGMFASALCRDDRKAMSLCLGLILLFAFGFPLLGFLIALRWKTMIHPAFLLPSPGYTGFIAFDQTAITFRSLSFFSGSLLCVHGLAWAFLTAACFIVPRTWQDRPPSTAPTSGWAWRWVGMRASPERRRAFRRRLLDLNPFCWLAMRNRRKPALVWLFLFACGMLWLWGHLSFRRNWFDPSIHVFTALTLHTVLKYWVASEASQRFIEDRSSGALEQLLATPLSIREILQGQLAALARQFAAPAVVVLIADFLFLQTDRTDRVWVYVWAAGMIMFVADIVTLSWVGMWQGLKQRRSNRAVGTALAGVCALPWGIFIILLTVISASAPLRTRWIDEDFLVAAWLLIGLVIDVMLASRSRRRLLRDFRQTATRRFAGPAISLSMGRGPG